MRIAARLTACCIVLITMVITSAANASGYTSTRYPLVLVHGFMGFDQFAGIDYFYRVPGDLRQSGSSVHVVKLSALNSNEVRGEQLVSQIEGIIALTGAEKVNLVGHSQGGLAARYAASMIPGQVASVTTIASPNQVTGFPLGEWVSMDYPIGTPEGDLVNHVLTALSQLVDLYSGVDSGLSHLAQSYEGFLNSINVAGLTQFNTDHPQALATSSCGSGAAVVDGIRYYSWSGAKVATNLFDISDYALLMASEITGQDSDGLVTRCGSHLGEVIRDNYPMNHLDEINHLFGFYGLFATNPMVTYRSHANRLKNVGL